MLRWQLRPFHSQKEMDFHNYSKKSIPLQRIARLDFTNFFEKKTELLHAERYVILKSDLRGVSQWFQIAKTRRKKVHLPWFHKKIPSFQTIHMISVSGHCMRYAENSKFVKTVVDIYQFNELFNLIFGGFFAICPKCVLCEAVTHHWLLSTSKPTPDKTNGGLRRFIFHNVFKNVLKSPKTLNTLTIWQDLF